MIALVAALWTSTDPIHWQWPLRPAPPILRTFDPPAHPWEAGHRGVDLSAHPKQIVYATGPGRVTYAHDLAGRGVITVDHGSLRTTYLPVTPSVHTGQTVRAGAPLGRLEGTLGHCGQTSCLHWGLLRDRTYLDPLSLLGLVPVRLLPWWPAPNRSPESLPSPSPSPSGEAAPSPTWPAPPEVLPGEPPGTPCTPPRTAWAPSRTPWAPIEGTLRVPRP